MSDLYADLGLARDASPDDIKKAYRSLAQKLHPDKDGGDKDKFQRVQAAYDILSDPEKRQRYDTTGKTKEGPSIEDEALSGMIQIVQQVIDGVEVEHRNIIHVTRDHTIKLKGKVIAEKNDFSKRIKKREQVVKRLTRKAGEPNLIILAMQNAIVDLRKQHDRCERNEKVFECILRMLSDYEYRTDPCAPEQETLAGLFGSSFFSMG
jgi:curved DNA-binding protein CbpA